MIGEKHLHALTHKGSADDGKRFSSDGRCVRGRRHIGIEVGSGGEGARIFPGTGAADFEILIISWE